MKQIKPSLVFKYKWMLPLLILGATMTPLSIVMLSLKISGPMLSSYLMVWGASTALLVFGFANRAAIQLAYDEKRIDDDAYRHWVVRSGIGIKIFSVLTVGLTCFFGFMMTSQRITVTIQAVPTKAIVTELEQYWENSDIDYSKIDFNDALQELTFRTNEKRSSGIPALIDAREGEFPEYYLNNEKIEVDYSAPINVEIFEYNGQRTCFYTRQITGVIKNDGFLKVKHNLPFGYEGAFVFNGKLVLDASAVLEVRNNENYCRGYYLTRKNSTPEKHVFREYRMTHIEYPNLTFHIKSAEESNRLVLRSWSDLNSAFGG